MTPFELITQYSNNRGITVEEYITNLSSFIKRHGEPLANKSLWIYEELGPVCVMCERAIRELGKHVERSYIGDLTFAIRLKALLEHIADENVEIEAETAYSEYLEFSSKLIDIQIAMCEDENRWYFRNLNMI